MLCTFGGLTFTKTLLLVGVGFLLSRRNENFKLVCFDNGVHGLTLRWGGGIIRWILVSEINGGGGGGEKKRKRSPNT